MRGAAGTRPADSHPDGETQRTFLNTRAAEACVRRRRDYRAVMGKKSTFELGRRTGKLPAPPSVVWESLAEPMRPKARHWLNLLDDEVRPRTLKSKSVKPSLLVWTSIWPKTPEQRIRFDLSPDGEGTALTWTLTSPTEVTDPSALGHRRYRLNRLFWQDLRRSYGS